MSSNTFNGRRFLLLWRQYFIHNTQLLYLATVGYVGMIFFILSLAQIGNDLRPHDLETFRGTLLAFVGVFGVIYIGHSFPAFRSKEKSINYLMVPSSSLEKFLFELISRLGIIVLLLPTLFWITFHFQGYFLSLFSGQVFEPVSIRYLGLPEIENQPWISVFLVSGILLGFVVAFTGAAMFVRQPLVKTLFAVGALVILYSSFIYLVLEHLGVGNYNPPESMWLFPMQESKAFRFLSLVTLSTIVLMLFVGFRKTIEKEV